MSGERLAYRLCPTCLRATPPEANELFCPIDGTRMRSACPRCGSAIHTPYARHCTVCGSDLIAGGPVAVGHRPQEERTR